MTSSRPQIASPLILFVLLALFAIPAPAHACWTTRPPTFSWDNYFGSPCIGTGNINVATPAPGPTRLSSSPTYDPVKGDMETQLLNAGKTSVAASPASAPAASPSNIGPEPYSYPYYGGPTSIPTAVAAPAQGVPSAPVATPARAPVVATPASGNEDIIAYCNKWEPTNKNCLAQTLEEMRQEASQGTGGSTQVTPQTVKQADYEAMIAREDAAAGAPIPLSTGITPVSTGLQAQMDACGTDWTCREKLFQATQNAGLAPAGNAQSAGDAQAEASYRSCIDTGSSQQDCLDLLNTLSRPNLVETGITPSTPVSGTVSPMNEYDKQSSFFDSYTSSGLIRSESAPTQYQGVITAAGGDNSYVTPENTPKDFTQGSFFSGVSDFFSNFFSGWGGSNTASQNTAPTIPLQADNNIYQAPGVFDWNTSYIYGGGEP